MAKRRASERKKNKTLEGRPLWRLPWQLGTFVLATAGVLVLLSFLPLDTGLLGGYLNPLLVQLLGRGGYLLGIGLLLFSAYWFARQGAFGPQERRAAAGFLLGFFSLLGFLHLLDQPGLGGGYLGGVLGFLLLSTLGGVGAALSLFVALFAGIFLVFQPTREGLRQALSLLRRPTPSSLLPKIPRLPTVEEKGPVPVSVKVEERPRSSRIPQLEIPELQAEEVTPPPLETELPPLELLEKSPEKAWGEEDVEKNARIIENTLSSFGVPAKVVSIVPGPTVTQFGLEPGYIPAREGGPPRRVRVSQITSLSKDLELALAASPVRIEAPVPGRPLVGIEVPNSQTSLVSLHGVMESEVYQKVKSPLKIALGRNVSGQPVVADLATMPHLLIAGATGSGKSVCLRSIVVSLLFQNPPDRLQFILIDPKPVELVHFAGLPHLAGPVVHEVDEALRALQGAIREMGERYEKFKEIGARHLAQYNARAEAHDRSPLPAIVIVVDELADLMLYAPFEVEQKIARLAQMSRATGIHLAIATQRPSVDVVTGIIKANFPARISFAVSSQVDSRVILDVAGAEALVGRGDMLYKAPDSASPVRLQGSFVSDKEVNHIVRWWQTNYFPPDVEPGPLWAGIEEEIHDTEESGDELLERAVALIKQHQYASTSFLQRKLGIGYPRAARLMDQLEELGYVTPGEPGGRSRKVVRRDDTPKEGHG